MVKRNKWINGWVKPPYTIHDFMIGRTCYYPESDNEMARIVDICFVDDILWFKLEFTEDNPRDDNWQMAFNWLTYPDHNYELNKDEMKVVEWRR